MGRCAMRSSAEPIPRAILAALESANRFIVPLDDRGAWYRDHRLLRDLLQSDLERDDSDDIARLGDQRLDLVR